MEYNWTFCQLFIIGHLQSTCLYKCKYFELCSTLFAHKGLTLNYGIKSEYNINIYYKFNGWYCFNRLLKYSERLYSLLCACRKLNYNNKIKKHDYNTAIHICYLPAGRSIWLKTVTEGSIFTHEVTVFHYTDRPKPADNMFSFFPAVNWFCSQLQMDLFTQLCYWIGWRAVY